ncbi:GNAT family N-acetyltransferase [Nocardia sp. NPDC051570]|uniref:GNAT family N-acetyltransferase n=1 Tax=Nocardia sp. NPDC051570 TaxID=3364324 RepID=UPI0037B2464D
MTLRPLDESDGDTLTELIRRNREFLHGWMPAGDMSDDESAAWVRDLITGRGTGDKWFGLIELDGRVEGALSMRVQHGIVGAATLGYWVSEHANGKGVVTEAIRQCLDMAFWEMGLHRVEAFVREDNHGSRRALEKNGFHRVGLSRGHMHIAGRWWDMIYFQKIAPWDDGVRLTPPADRAR